MAFTFRTIVLKEINRRKGRLISGLLAITLGIAVIVAIQSITAVSKQVVAKKLDLLGANIMVLPQGATVDEYYSADVDGPTFPEEYVERIATAMIPGVDNMSPKLSRRIEINGSSVILTGILPANELASKPIWQASGLMGAELALTCAPAQGKESSLTDADMKAQRKAVDSLGTSEMWIGSSAAERLGSTADSMITVAGRTFSITHVLPETGTIDDNRVFAHLHNSAAATGHTGTGEQYRDHGLLQRNLRRSPGKLRNILPDTRYHDHWPHRQYPDRDKRVDGQGCAGALGYHHLLLDRSRLATTCGPMSRSVAKKSARSSPSVGADGTSTGCFWQKRSCLGWPAASSAMWSAP
jgi:putative ABC transport system permease protein